MLGMMFFAAIALLFWVILRMTPKRADGRRRVLPAILIGVGILVYLFANPIGYIDTQLACRQDGGLRGQVPQKRAGFFWDRGPGKSDCTLCAEYVLDRKVAYVDYEVYGKTNYYQVTLGHVGDPGCSTVRGNGDARLAEGECLVILPLESIPVKGYSYSAFKRWGWPTHVQGKLGSILVRNVHEIRDLSSDQPLLTFTTYRYAPPIERMFGSEQGTYRCPDKMIDQEKFLAMAFTSNRDSERK